MAVQSYIPAGFRVVIINAGNEAVWYTTKSEVRVTDDTGADRSSSAKCPLTEGDVLTVKFKGIQVYFHPSQVRHRDPEAEKAIKASRPCLLIYDIPDRSPCPNPSGWLRLLGVRVNLSGWVLPEGSIPYARLHTMASQGVTWHVVRFGADEAARVVDMVVRSLRKELEDATARAEETRVKAEAELDAEGKASTYARAKTLRDKADGLVKRIEKLTAELTKGAAALGIDPSVFDGAKAGTVARTLRTAMHERARLFVQAGVAAKRHGAEGNAIANAVAADAIHPGIVGDFLMEKSDAESAALGEAVVEAFQSDE